MKFPPWMSTPITPLLAALYPFIYFLAANLNQFRVGEIWRTFSVLVAVAILLTAVARLLIRNWQKTALSVAALLLGFLTYGHWFQWIKNTFPALARTFLWFPLAVLLISAILWWILRSKRDLFQPVAVSNLILAALILISGIPLAAHWIRLNEGISASPIATPTTEVSGSKPDLYLIILDEYPRADKLLKNFNYDNSSFTKSLEELGFFVASCSQSNYGETIESIYTMLNLEYLNNYIGPDGTTTTKLSRDDLAKGIRKNRLMSILKTIGYKTVSFDTTYPFTEIRTSDVYTRFVFDPRKTNHFEYVFTNTTILYAIKQIAIRVGIQERNSVTIDPSMDIDNIEESPEYSYANKMFGLDQLDKAISIPGPKFVFAHLLASHRPILFDRNGNYLGVRKKNDEDYKDMLRYVNSRILSSVINIKKNHGPDPIILIMSDHGLRIIDDMVFTNFIAVYAPKSVIEKFSDSITPLNVMRGVTTYISEANFPMIGDHSYAKKRDEIGAYQEVMNSCSVNIPKNK